jgi:hypothetical protein
MAISSEADGKFELGKENLCSDLVTGLHQNYELLGYLGRDLLYTIKQKKPPATPEVIGTLR